MPDAITLAGQLAVRGALMNAGIALSQHMRAGEAVGRHPIERNQRRRLYSERLTELCDMCGIVLEEGER